MRRLAVIFAFLLPLSLRAQEPRFVNYGAAHGLPSNTVYAITQDADGILWVGTRNGLCSFDGATFRSWKEYGRVTALTPDRENRLWIGTQEGLAVSSESGKATLPGLNIRALLTDSDGYVWAMAGDTLILKLTFDAGIRELARTPYDKIPHEGDYP